MLFGIFSKSSRKVEVDQIGEARMLGKDERVSVEDQTDHSIYRRISGVYFLLVSMTDPGYTLLW